MTTMTTDQKGKLIGLILTHLKFHAAEHKKPFDYGDTFISLAFKSDDELRTIARLAGV